MGGSDHLHLLVTGGTIDSVFDPAQDSITVSDNSIITNFLEKIIKPHFVVTAEIVCLKDSRQITEATRKDMLYSIKRSPSQFVLITHGTYTMPETAEYLAKYSEEFQKTRVVLTGSFYPLKSFADGDASFNLGFAIAACFNSEPGVYLAMNGKLFSAGKVGKNIQKARFE